MSQISIYLILALVASIAQARTSGVKATGPACPLPDPANSPAGLLNVTLEPLLEIFSGSTHGELSAIGLSTLSYEYTVNLITLAATFDITLPSVDVECPEYSAEGWIDLRPLRQETLPSGNFTGNGSGDFSIRNLRITGSATMFVNLIGNKVSVRVLNLDTFSFDLFNFNLGPNYRINGEPLNYDQINQNLKQNFDTDFAEFKAEITEDFRQAMNVVVGQYSLEELLELISNPGGGEGCATEAP